MEVKSIMVNNYRFLQAEVIDWIGGLKTVNHYFLKNISNAPTVHKKRIRKFYTKIKVVRIQRKIKMKITFKKSGTNLEDGI